MKRKGRLRKTMTENTENQTNVNNDSAQEEITVENIEKYRDVLEKKLEERKTPNCIKNAFLFTVDYINDYLSDHQYGVTLYYIEQKCQKMDIIDFPQEETTLRISELDTIQEISKILAKSPYATYPSHFITIEDKKKALLQELLPYFE